MAFANSASNLESPKTGYIPPFRPLPIVGEGPIEALESSGGTLIDHAAQHFSGEDAKEAEDLGGGEGREDAKTGGHRKHRFAGPPDARFRVPTEAFAALIEFFEMLSRQVSDGFGGHTPGDVQRIRRAASAYELIEQVIQGTLPKPGKSLSIAL